MIVYLLGTGGNQDHNDHYDVHATLEGAKAAVAGEWNDWKEGLWNGPDDVSTIWELEVKP